MGVDGRECEILEPVPVVARLVGDEYDGVGLGGGGDLEPVAGVLEVAGDCEGHLAGAFELTDVPVGEKDDGQNVFPYFMAGSHVPGADLSAVVAHTPSVVDHDRDRATGNCRDHLVHDGMAGEWDAELVAGLQGVEVDHRLATDDDRLVAVVTLAAPTVGVTLRELSTTLGVHTRELALVHDRDRLPRHIVLGGDGRDDRIARLDFVLDLLLLGLRGVHDDVVVRLILTHEGQGTGTDADDQGEDGQGDNARAVARAMPPVT